MEIKSNIINKPKQLITVEGYMGLRERKVYNSLLALIEKEPFPEKETGKYYHTSLNEIANLTNITDWKLLKDILINKLPNTRLKIDLLNKDLSLNGMVIQLVGEIIPTSKTEMKVFFTPSIIKMVENKNYTKLELDILVKLNSKYSLTMYEIIKRYYVSETSFYTIPDMKIEDFKTLMGINENEYSILNNFKKRVLDQIIKDINDKTDFNIDYELFKKNSRSFNYIRFNFSKKGAIAEPITTTKEEDNNIKVKELEQEKEDLAKQLEYYKKLANMAIDKADAEHQKELEEKEQKGLPF